MPATSLYLFALQPSTSIAGFIPLLVSSTSQPIVVARARRWMITPWITAKAQSEQTTVDTLTSTSWHLLVIYPTTVALPASITPCIAKTYSLAVGIPSRLLASFADQNTRLLHPSTPPPPLTGALTSPRLASTSQNLELTREIIDWFSQASTAPRGAVSMLNFLAMNEGKLESYKAYGKAFATDVGKRRGGLAKVVGPVIGAGEKNADNKVWDEIALAHYPSIWHFADMTASEDYQKVNAQHRIAALRGTAILCCDELDDEVQQGLRDARATKAKI